ncbi:hypothetical protein KAZ93_00335 [Patescibacteria group bacterium]|nr:hypothetical protein [Patescibacteria group bacterium]
MERDGVVVNGFGVVVVGFGFGVTGLGVVVTGLGVLVCVVHDVFAHDVFVTVVVVDQLAIDPVVSAGLIRAFMVSRMSSFSLSPVSRASPLVVPGVVCIISCVMSHISVSRDSAVTPVLVAPVLRGVREFPV